MFVLVVGGGKVGYYLTKELSESGHEVVLMEKDRVPGRPRSPTRSARSWSPRTAARGARWPRRAPTAPTSWRRSPATTRTTSSSARWRSTTSPCRKTIARVNNPKNEPLFKHLGVDELISPTRMILGSIEQDIPVHELLHLAPLSGDFELIEAHLDDASPAVGRNPRDIELPDGCAIVAIVRDDMAQAIRGDTVLRAGDKVIATGRPECEPALHETLIGAIAP